MGGTETDPGIFINWTLRLGTTASRCITFNKFWPISRDLVFDIRILELWVVNEVFMKKRNAAKRDFYSTVVMWNRIGKHKAKGDRRRTDRRDCYHDGLANDDHCSQDEVHETDERHFQPSDTSLAGTNNIDDELLMAIKNRLAGVPLPGALNLKPAAGLQKINQELPTSTKQHYIASTQPDKPKKFPTQVSTQVDDSMITELKNQSTSTSNVKVTSRFTQSGIGLAAQTEDTQPQPSNSSGRNRRDLYQSSLPQKNTPPNEILRLDEQYQRSLQPRRNSFPNHTKQSLRPPAPLSPHTNYVDPRPVDAIGSSLQSDRISVSLPGVPDYFGVLPQRPSVSRSIRSSIDESQYNQIHELSWSNRRNMGAILPYQQQQLVRAAQDRQGDLYEDDRRKEPSQSRSIMRDASGDRVGRERSQTGNQYRDQQSPTRSMRGDEVYQEPSQQRYNQSPARSMRENGPYQPQSRIRTSPARGPRDLFNEREELGDSYQGPSQYDYRPSPPRSLREDPSTRVSPYQDQPREGSYMDRSPPRVKLDLDRAEPREAMSPPPPVPPGDQTVLAMTTAESNQLCKCGSKELNLICSCKKSILRETKVSRTEQGFRECTCPRNCDDDHNESKNKKKKKDKRGKTDKEAKAEEKRRKKEEKEREKREKKEQKAREKEARKSKGKGDKKNKNKKECKMCTCCKCCGDEETTTLQSEACQPEDTSKKKSKKEKKSKEKKQKEKKRKKSKSEEHCDDPPLRSCNCPPHIRMDCPPPIQMDSPPSVRLVETSPPPQVQVQQQVYQQQSQVQHRTYDEPSPLGYCNDPDTPCPALYQGRVQSRRSVMVQPSSETYCRDPACTKRRGNRRESCCSEVKARSCCCLPNSGGYETNVSSYPAMVEQPDVVYPASTGIRENRPSLQLRTSETSPGTSRYRDITAAPALIYPNEVGHGDTHLGRSLNGPPKTSLPSEFSTNENLLIDMLKRGRENSNNKRYVPPCVLYLDCTKVKDLCVIIKDKYEEDPS